MSREKRDVEGRARGPRVGENGDGRRRCAPRRAERWVREREEGDRVEVRQVGNACAADYGNVDGTFTRDYVSLVVRIVEGPELRLGGEHRPLAWLCSNSRPEKVDTGEIARLRITFERFWEVCHG